VDGFLRVVAPCCSVVVYDGVGAAEGRREAEFPTLEQLNVPVRFTSKTAFHASGFMRSKMPVTLLVSEAIGSN
jgi:hypothetical protein